MAPAMLGNGFAIWRRHFLFKKSSRSSFADSIVFCRHSRLRRGFLSIRLWLQRTERLKRIEERLGLGRQHYRINVLRKCFLAIQSIYFSSRNSVLRWHQRQKLVVGFGSWVRMVSELQEQSQAQAIGAKVFFRKIGNKFLSRLRRHQSLWRAETDRLTLSAIFHSLVAFKIGLTRLFLNRTAPSRASIVRGKVRSLQRYHLNRQRGSLSQCLRLLAHRANVRQMLFLKLLTFHRNIAIQFLHAWLSKLSVTHSLNRLLSTVMDVLARKRRSKALRNRSCASPPPRLTLLRDTPELFFDPKPAPLSIG
jgi:hypothetical protein